MGRPSPTASRFWIADYEHDDEARDEARTAIFYAFGRRGIEIPWPIEVGYSRDWPEPDAATKQQERERVLARVDLFSRLTDDQRRDIAAASCDPAVWRRRRRSSGRTIPASRCSSSARARSRWCSSPIGARWR